MKINYSDLVLNKNIQYTHNPFGGIDDEELLDIIDPKHSFEELIKILNQDHPIIIQFLGKKGRGKTTHLRALHQLISNSEIHFLDRNSYKKITNPDNRNLLIDSVHHIPLRKRLQLWKSSNTSYVVTTHIPRNIEFLFCKRKYKTIHFKGLSLIKLESILKKRIAQYSSIEQNKVIIDTTALKMLLKHYGDNIRGLLNFLYDCFKVEFYGY
ncbi:hypothetical protein J8L88_10570 [Aquimarina sp. MMG015]|uniref:hypothetical protein n=1 Tax=Aquimarina sp. MMG015 TaxID=2822689 RepID=UPI001B39D2DF|nr:hypothetical protein [Aquimarina sp. MMG015]MBQ4803292.1 hypothetical protein [Aquimarina sp. MMG015]